MNRREFIHNFLLKSLGPGPTQVATPPNFWTAAFKGKENKYSQTDHIAHIKAMINLADETYNMVENAEGVKSDKATVANTKEIERSADYYSAITGEPNAVPA